jgi:ribonuclease P protein component
VRVSVLNRFPRKARLRANHEFKTIYRQGKKVPGRGFILIVKNNDVAHARIGISIPKRNISLASKRTRLKRLIRESFRAQQTCLPNIDVVVIALPSSASLNNAEVFTNLKSLWDKLCVR